MADDTFTRRLESEFELLKSEIVERVLKDEGYRPRRGTSEADAPQVANQPIESIYREQKLTWLAPARTEKEPDDTPEMKKTFGRRVFSALGQGMGYLLVIVLLLNALSLFVLNAKVMAMICAASSAIIILAKLVYSRIEWLRIGTILTFLIVLMFIAGPSTMSDVSKGLRRLGDVGLTKGPEYLNFYERTGLWWSAVWLSIGGIVYWTPYAVAENTLMLFPGRKYITWHSDFPLKSKKVRGFIKSAKSALAERYSLFGHRFNYYLGWKSYCADHCDVGLSLNGGKLNIEFTRNYFPDASEPDMWCRAEVEVDVSYKPKYRSSTILRIFGSSLKIDQAAYWNLQQLGWLHPYTLTYKWNC